MRKRFDDGIRSGRHSTSLVTIHYTHVHHFRDIRERLGWSIGSRLGFLFNTEKKKKKKNLMMKSVSSYPLGELCVHHKIVDVFLSSRQLQFPRDDSNEQRRAASTLQHWINPQSTLFWLVGQRVDWIRTRSGKYSP